MKLLKIILLNISNYGIIEYGKMAIFETLYLFNSRYREHFFHDESATNSYEEIDLKNQSLIFDGSYNPTPIYHLKLIEKVLKKKNLSNFTFIDFGSGAGRVTFFFRKMFEKIIGIDFNERYKKFYKDQIFLIKDIRNIKSLDDLSILENDENFVLFFYRPIEDESLFKIIELFKNKKSYIITLNVKKNNSSKLYVLYEKYFADKNRNIIIYSNFLI